MNANIIKKEKNIVSVEFTVSSEDFQTAVNKAYLKMRNNVAVQGFRKGKAPRHLIERMYGKAVFYDEAVEIVLSEAYPKVIEELKLKPIDRPQVDFKDIEEGKDIVFTADVEVAPEVELKQYKGIEIEKIEYNVTDEDVDNEIKKIQEKNSRIIEVTDRVVKEGDTLTIDYAGFTGDVQFEGGTAQNQTLVIGSKSFIPGFEEQLIGKNIGEECEINVTFPEEYHSEELKGKDATFKVTIHEIKEKELPVLDDEFAKDVSEFDTLEELRADARKKLEEEAKEKEKVENSDKVLKKIIEENEIEIPEIMVERELDYQGRRYENQFRSQGFTGKQADELIEQLVNQFKANYREQAIINVKSDIIMDAIIKAENITATEEDLTQEIKKLAEAYYIEDDKFEGFKENMLVSSRDAIVENIQKIKALDLILEEAKFI